jgi:hypothetical protein
LAQCGHWDDDEPAFDTPVLEDGDDTDPKR